MDILNLSSATSTFKVVPIQPMALTIKGTVESAIAQQVGELLGILINPHVIGAIALVIFLLGIWLGFATGRTVGKFQGSMKRVRK